MSYSKFKKDINKMIGFGGKGFQIDKDLLIKGNKHYSRENCLFLPYEVNTFLAFNRGNKGEYPVGVNFHNKSGLFVAKISIDRKRLYLGYFNKPLDAFLEYKNKKELHAKVLAERWRGQISELAHTVLMEFEVTDATLTDLLALRDKQFMEKINAK